MSRPAEQMDPSVAAVAATEAANATSVDWMKPKSKLRD